LSTPCSRRSVTVIARAWKVVAMTAMPAIPGTIVSSASWSPAKTIPKSARKSSGRTTVKNAADGLRQNSRRSSRNCRQASTAVLTR
jgi:hypothetical protein